MSILEKQLITIHSDELDIDELPVLRAIELIRNNAASLAEQNNVSVDQVKFEIDDSWHPVKLRVTRLETDAECVARVEDMRRDIVRREEQLKALKEQL